jgi:hypothetical protein
LSSGCSRLAEGTPEDKPRDKPTDTL